MPADKLSITIPPETVAAMRERGDNLSGAIARALERYLEMLSRERVALRALLSDAELSLVLDAMNGIYMLDQHSPAWIGYEVADAIKLNQADKKWGVDGPALNSKLAGLSYPASCALADVAERFWRRVGSGENPKPSEALA
jgi:hypothetical protein